MEAIEFFMNFKIDILYWIAGVVTMLGLYELWRRWFVKVWNRGKHRVMGYRYEYNDDRYVYPKKELSKEEVYAKELSRCNREIEKHLEYNGKLPDVYLDNKEEPIMQNLANLSAGSYKDESTLDSIKLGYAFWESPNGTYAFNEKHEVVLVEQYMRRGNKRYFRGHNVKVIVTVEE